MGSKRSTLSILIILCVLTVAQGFCLASISPDLQDIQFSVRVLYNGELVDVVDSGLSGSNSVTFGSGNWIGTITAWADYSGDNKIALSTTIGGISSEQAPNTPWDGTGLAITFTTSNGYTIDLAELGYFDGSAPLPAVSEDVTVEGMLIAFGIGVLLWQVFAGSMRERSVMW